MDSELFQRAFALGRLIAASVHREPHDYKEVESERELSWAASSLAAQLLQRAQWFLRPLSVSEAEPLVGTERFAELCGRHVVRVVFEVVEVLSRSDLDERVEGLSEEDRADIGKLREQTWRENRPKLWIEESVLRSLVEAHATCHPATPSWEMLIAPLTAETRESKSGYSFRVDRAAHGGWLWEVLAAASAKLWMSMLTADRSIDSTTVLEWLLRAGGRWLEAPSRLPTEQRERLLSAAVVVLKEDPNLGDLDSELRVLRLDRARSPTLPTFSTLASLHLFWKRLDQFSRRGLLDETRSRLFGLISLVVKYDGLPKGGVPERIIELAELGAQKPYLLYDLALALQWSRPDTIAWLLTRPSTAAFGMLLLGELQLQEPTMMDEWEHRAARIQARRLVLMREALPVFVRAIALGAEGGKSSSPAIAALEVLRGFARDCVKQSLFDEKQKALALAHAEEVFSVLVANLAAAEPGYRIVSSSPEHLPRLLAECADALVAQLGTAFPPTERHEALKVAHEVLRFLRENRPAFVSRPTGTVEILLRDVVAKIAAWYVDCFELDADAKSFRYFFRPPALIKLPWAMTACTLQEDDAVRPWLLLPPLRAKLIGAASADAKEATEILAGGSSRLRVHLEMLLGSYIDCRNVLSASRATRDAVGEALEKTIEELVLARTDAPMGNVDLFDRALVINATDDDSLARLVRLTVKVVTKFDPSDSDRIIRKWIDKTADPVILLDIEKELRSPAHLRLVQEKLAEPGTLDRAEKDGWFNSLVDMASEAAAANHIALAERLLKRGDEVTASHPWRAQWERVAFRARLLIAYHRGARDEVFGLGLPKSAVGDRQDESDQRRTLERNRAFYVALLDLGTNPEAARTAFAEQLVDEPASAALVVNLFAARLRVAKGIEETSSRKQGYEDALRWWDRIRTSTPDQSGLEPYGTLNELLALDGAELDDEFDARWFRLDEDIRGRLDLVALRLENLQRRGLREEQTRLLDGARLRYGDALPSGLEKVKTPEPVAAPLAHLTTEAYRNYWSEIRGLPPQELARVVGPTRRRELHDYLLHIHVNAAAEMLKRFSTVASLRNEDKLNDLIVSYVDMQVSMLDWSVHDQTRGGLSANGGGGSTSGGVGERDWVVRRQTREVCICEALRLTSVDSGEINIHVKKLVERYNPQGAESSFVVVYYEGTKFDDFAERYRTYVETLSLSGWYLEVAPEWQDLESTRLKAFRAKASKDAAAMAQDHILVDVGPPTSATGVT